MTPDKILSKLPGITDKKEITNLLKDVSRSFSFALQAPEAKEGAEAYRNGLKMENNPYERNDQAAFWLSGFMYEMKTNKDNHGKI
jgi:hypothetical protein